MWHDRHEQSVDDIAKQLNISRDSVKHTLRQALKKLRDGRADKFRDLMIAREREKHYPDLD